LGSWRAHWRLRHHAGDACDGGVRKITKAVVLLSGGLDSLTCLALAQSQGYETYPISFDYGQKHRAELKAAEAISKTYQRPHRIIQLQDLGRMGGSALTDGEILVKNSEENLSQAIPNTYVPSRNIIFLSIAASYAEIIQANTIFIGVSSVDYSGYPDCRPEFIQAFSKVLDLGTKAGIENQGLKIQAPLLQLSKSETIALGLSLGVDYHLSVSCYRANEKGEACGTCDSCKLRRLGFEALGLPEQTRFY